jgi:hypothetical protein
MAIATPKWVDHNKVVAIYKESKSRRDQGEDTNVDHVVPLNHPHVCGLHWHGNLAVITKLANDVKSNHCWPDMWHEQFELFENQEAEQYELPLSMLN